MEANQLLQTNDAMVWAEEFVRTSNKMNWTLEDIDEGLMVGWFANAMFAQELKSNKEPCRDCIILEKALRFIIDVYLVAYKYEGDEREKRIEVAYERVVKKFTGKE